MEDIGIFDDLADALDNVIDATKSGEETASESFERFKNTLPKELESFKNTEIVKTEDGWVIKGGPDGDVNLSEMERDKLSGEIEDAYRPVFGEQLDTEAGKEFIEKQTDAWNESPYGKNQKFYEDANKAGEKLGFKADMTEDEFNKVVNDGGGNIDEMNKQMKEVQAEGEKRFGEPPGDDATQEEIDKYKDDVAKDKTFGQYLVNTVKWFGEFVKDHVLGILGLVLLYLISKSIYDFVKNLEHALSGCMSTTKDGKTCKIYALSCRQDVVSPKEGLISGPNLCDSCTDIQCADFKNNANSSGYWVPLKLSDSCPCNPNASDKSCLEDPNNCYPGPHYNPDAETGFNTCKDSSGKSTNPKCPVTPTNRYKCVHEGFETDKTPACQHASGCVARCEACSDNWGDNCSSWCDSTKIHTIPGQSIGCRNCNFSCAAGSIFKHILSWPSDLLGGIEKILLWVLIVGVLLFLVVWIGKEILHKIGDKGHDKHGKHDMTVYVKKEK